MLSGRVANFFFFFFSVVITAFTVKEGRFGVGKGKAIINTTVRFRFVGGKVRVTLIPIFIKYPEWGRNFSNHLTRRNLFNLYKNPMKLVPR